MNTNALKVWQIDDCDFVAATSLPEAMGWYVEQYGLAIEGEAREAEEVGLDTQMRMGESADSERITFAEQIKRMTVAGATFPAVIAMDAHYL